MIEDGDPRPSEVALVSGADGQVMYSCGGRDEQIRLAEGDAPFPAICHHAPPPQDHFLVHGKDAAREPRPQCLIEPSGEFHLKAVIRL